MQLAVCNLYPTDYWGLKGITGIDAPPELWWSSRERQAFEDGVPTSEYLELDFGRLRTMNFMNFNIIQKPIDITVEYDVWGFDAGVKFWQPVTRVPNERFDNLVSYTPNAANPWKNCQFYFTNVKGDLLSTRYLRIRFDRRNEQWPNGDVANTFPWSIDVKSLRTARYVIDLNDTRGVLVQQGKVTSPIVDPVHYDDLATDIPTVVGVPSGTDIYTISPAHDGETYFALYASEDPQNGDTNADGYNGFTAVDNVTGGEAKDAANFVRGGGYYDVNEVGHARTDLPSLRVGYNSFVGAPPSPVYVWMFGLGTLVSSTVLTSTLGGKNNYAGKGSTFSWSTGINWGVNESFIFSVMVGDSGTITDYSLLTAAGFALAYQGTVDPTTHFTPYVFTLTTPNAGSAYTTPSISFSGNVRFAATIGHLLTPSDPTNTVYLIDSGIPGSDPTPAAFTGGWRFNSAVHG